MAVPIQAVQQIERYVRERRDTDRPLVSWALYIFLLGPITFGIYGWIVFYRRVNRMELFRVRKSNYYDAVLDFTKQYAEEGGQYDVVHDQVSDLENYKKDRFTTEHKRVDPSMAVLLGIVTFGIYLLIMYHQMMRFWWEIQITEQDFDEKLSQTWTKLGVVRYPVTFQPLQELRREFLRAFLLSIVTFGIYAIIWDHQLHTDPDKVYPEFHSVEDTVLNAARNPAAPTA